MKKKNLIIKFTPNLALLFAFVDTLKEKGIEKDEAMKLGYTFYSEIYKLVAKNI